MITTMQSSIGEVNLVDRIAPISQKVLLMRQRIADRTIDADLIHNKTVDGVLDAIARRSIEDQVRAPFDHPYNEGPE